jgi:murein L,D-transpeptidase YafK
MFKKTSIITSLLASLIAIMPYNSLGNIEKKQTPPEAYLVMKKSEQKIYLVTENESENYPAVYGKSLGKKSTQGDRKTPEGNYFICMINPNSEWDYFYGLNYPNEKDGKEALEAGQITLKEYNAIAEAEKKGVCPPWNTSLGGEIGIHGTNPERIGLETIINYADWINFFNDIYLLDKNPNWTKGCIALRNQDFYDIRSKIKGLGTKVIIQN